MSTRFFTLSVNAADHQAFTSIVFSVELVQQQQPLLPFMEIIPMLPDTAYQTVSAVLFITPLRMVMRMTRTLSACPAHLNVED
jgi:hypothetical protein